MVEKIKGLLDLQNLDLKIADVRDELASIPLRCAEIDKEIKEYYTTLEDLRARLDDTEHRWHSVEIELEKERDLLKKYSTQQMSVRTEKEYVAVMNEIRTQQKKVAELERQLKGLIQERKDLEKEVQRLEGEESERIEKKREEIRKLEERRAELEDELSVLEDERKRITARIDKEMLSRYERIAKARQGLAVMVVKEDGVCPGCHSVLPTYLFMVVKKGQDLVTCASCGRFLVYKGQIDK